MLSYICFFINSINFCLTKTNQLKIYLLDVLYSTKTFMIATLKIIFQKKTLRARKIGYDIL